MNEFGHLRRPLSARHDTVARPPALARPIDWDGTPFTFALFTWEFVQHESIHHGQWSLYASLAGFDTPLSWRTRVRRPIAR